MYLDFIPSFQGVLSHGDIQLQGGWETFLILGGQHTQVNIMELVTISSLKQELGTHGPDGFLSRKIMYFN